MRQLLKNLFQGEFDLDSMPAYLIWMVAVGLYGLIFQTATLGTLVIALSYPGITILIKRLF